MIQIDMPMPTNCLDCPACNEYLMCAIRVNGRGWGENDVKDFSQGRPEWCPMKEQEEQVISWTKQIAKMQQVHAPAAWQSDDQRMYSKGVWDGLQIAWNIISEGR